MIPVPYPGVTEAMTDVIAGRASVSILDISTALPFIRSGSVTPSTSAWGTDMST